MSIIDTDKFIVQASMEKHIDTGFVWIITPSYRGRHIVRISNQENKKTICCEAQKIGKNFIANYNDDEKNRKKIKTTTKTIVISKWYRDKLGIQKNKEVALKIEKAEWWSWGWMIRAAINHPNHAIRLATKIALLSVFLGVISIVSCQV